MVNWWLADEYVGGPWRLQELPETELKLNYGADSPDFGRRYQIFHNQICLGTLEISPSLLDDYSNELPRVRTRIELDWVRLLSFGALREFLTNIARHTANPNPESHEYIEVRQQFVVDLLDVLWQTQENSRFDDDP